MSGYNYIDLFHGIGGFALGASWAGMKFNNHFCSDIEPYAQELYKLRFPDSIQLGDITKIDTEELKKYGDKWIISGGFPCQDISIAGKGAGIHGERSGLWFEYWRLINDLRPRFAIMENVGMLIHRGLGEVLGSLAEIGYNAEWQDIRAEDVGAPHKRERIWIIAYPNINSEDVADTGQFTERSAVDGFSGELQHCEKEKLRTEARHRLADSGESKGKFPNAAGDTARGNKSRIRRQLGRTSEIFNEYPYKKISNTDNKRLQRWQNTGSSEEVRTDREQQFKRQSEQPGKHYWSIEPAVGRLANGIPRKLDRLKGLGNAIVPQIAEILFRQIKPYMEVKQ